MLKNKHKESLVPENTSKVMYSVNEPVKLFKKEEFTNNSEFLVLDHIDPNRSLDDSKSGLEFLILTLCKVFHIKPKVGAGLLTQNYSYLKQVISKGIKGDYEPINAWYDMLKSNIQTIIKLTHYDNIVLIMFLSCFQAGIFSTDNLIITKSAELLVLYYEKLNYMSHLCTDWFYNQSDTIFTCYQLIENHKEPSDYLVCFLFTYGKKKLIEVFYTKAKKYYKTSIDYLKFLQAVFPVITNPPYSQFFYNQGLIEVWTSIGLNEAEMYLENFDNKVLCLGFLCEVWAGYLNYLEIKIELAADILNLLKRCLKEITKPGKFMIYSKLFHLLSVFSAQKSSFAPVVYKTLIEFMVEDFYDEDIREYILFNMILILNEVEGIPISILIDPYIKMFQVDKDAKYNVFDFKFISFISANQGLCVRDAIFLLDLLGKVIANDLVFQFFSVEPFVVVVERFVGNSAVQEFIAKYVSLGVKLALKSVDKNEAYKVPGKLIYYCLGTIIKINNKDLNTAIRAVLYSNIDKIKKINQTNLLKLYNLIKETQGKQNPSEILSTSILPKGRVMKDLEKIKKKRLEKEKKDLEKKNAPKIKQKFAIIKKAKDEDLPIAKDGTEKDSIYELNRIQEELPEDQKLIEIVLKKYSRVSRLLFSKYAGSSYKKKLPVLTFENLLETKENLSEPDYSKLLRDNNINNEMISTEEIKQVYKALIIKLHVPTIKYENLGDLFYITSCLIFTRDPYDLFKYPSAVYYEALFNLIKDSENQSIPRYLFEEPDPGKGDRDIAKILNQELDKNPELTLPENYKKVKEPVFCVEYTAATHSPLFNIAVEVLDQILYQSLNIRLLMPMISIQYKTRAKGILPQQTNPLTSPHKESFPGFSKLSPYTKLSALNITGIPIQNIIECGKTIDDVLYTIEKNSTVLLNKHHKKPGSISNKAIQDKIIKKLEKKYENQRNEQKRKIRMQLINEKLFKFKQQKNIENQTELEERKKKIFKEKILEKQIKAKIEKEKFEIQEKIFEYKLNKIKNKVTGKGIVENKSSRIVANSFKTVNTSFEVIKPRLAHEKRLINITEHSRSISIPSISARFHKNY